MELLLDSNFENYKKLSQYYGFGFLALKMLSEIYPSLKIYKKMIKIFPENPAIYYMNQQEINDLVYSINNFIKSKKKYLAIYLGVFFSTNGHTTVLFLQKRKNKITMERYDPDYYFFDANQDDIDAYFKNFSDILGIEYISIGSLCPFFGPQAIANDSFGYCQTFSMTYIQHRLMYPFSNQEEILYMFYADPEKLKIMMDTFIKEIMKYIIKEHKPSGDRVNDLLQFKNRKEIYSYLDSLII